MNFCFGDIVVVEGYLMGVVVKSFGWGVHFGGGTSNSANAYKVPPHHEVYVRDYNCIKEYTEDQMQRYMVRHKELSDEELEWQNNAIKGL